jgi:Fibronectin type III-like domain
MLCRLSRHRAAARAQIAHLVPRETRIVRMAIAVDDLRYRDPATHSWRLEPGIHRLLVGGSSAGDHLFSEVHL